MEFGDAIKAGFQKYFDFSSRSLRSEYWWWTLFVFLVGFVLSFVDAYVDVFLFAEFGFFGSVFSLVTLIPGIAVGVRRLHDTDRSGWWLLLIVVPLIGFLVLLYWFASKGTEGPNDYGPNSLDAGDPADAA